MRRAGWVAALVFVVGGMAGSAGAQGCPDVRATSVRPLVEETDDGERCGIGISIFGLEISVFGPWCPSNRFTTPAHGKCDGEPSPGTECVLAGTVEILWEMCKCPELSLLGLGLQLPGCDCDVFPYSAGAIENWKTQSCPNN